MAADVSTPRFGAFFVNLTAGPMSVCGSKRSVTVQDLFLGTSLWYTAIKHKEVRDATSRTALPLR
jgi:hypothetical protein